MLDILLENNVDAFTTELATTEVRYILCRKYGWTVAQEKVSKLIQSGYISIISSTEMYELAAIYKCKRRLALPDCLILAAARIFGMTALFARKEKELVAEMEKEPFDVDVAFLEDFI